VDRSPTSPLIRIESGWLFLVAGMAVLMASALIPAYEELADVRWQRDRAAALEQHRIERLTNYESYLAAVERREPALIQSLAASQLRQIPADRSPLPGTMRPEVVNASVFPALEPPPLKLPERIRNNSLLSRLTNDDRTRPWLVLFGGVCLLIGLMPGGKRP